MMNEIRTDKEYRFEMAQLIRDELMIYINDGAKHWLNLPEPDEEMWDMVISDADDLRIVHTEIDRDNVPYAFSHACDLDTAVRDVIPTKVWNWMSKVHAASK
jgi:hypothetical protein